MKRIVTARLWQSDGKWKLPTLLKVFFIRDLTNRVTACRQIWAGASCVRACYQTHTDCLHAVTTVSKSLIYNNLNGVGSFHLPSLLPTLPTLNA